MSDKLLMRAASLVRDMDEANMPIAATVVRDLAARLAEAEARIESMRNDDWGSLRRRVESAEALLREALGHLQYGTQPSDLFLRIDAFLGAKP